MSPINIIAHPKDDSQVEAVKAFMKALKIKFEISKEKPYNPEFVAKMSISEQEFKDGESILVMPFEPFCEPPRLGRGECFIQRGFGMGIEVVLHQPDLLGLGEVDIGQFHEDLGIIHRSMVPGLDPGIRHPRLRGGRLFTCRQPSRGPNIMNRLAVPLRWYS